MQSDRELEAVRSTLAQNPPAELSSLRGEVATLRGEVATLQSQLSSLRSEVRFGISSQIMDSGVCIFAKQGLNICMLIFHSFQLCTVPRRALKSN